MLSDDDIVAKLPVESAVESCQITFGPDIGSTILGNIFVFLKLKITPQINTEYLFVFKDMFGCSTSNDFTFVKDIGTFTDL